MDAKMCKDMGELYEQESKFEQAIIFYGRAADLLESEEEITSAYKCKLKVAQFAAQLEQYPKAIEIFEEVARLYIHICLLKDSVKGILLNAGLCQLCTGDIVALTDMLERHQKLDPTFSDSRELLFLFDLLAAVLDEDFAGFTDLVEEFDSVTRLDLWKTTLLLRAKNTLQEKEEEYWTFKFKIGRFKLIIF